MIIYSIIDGVEEEEKCGGVRVGSDASHRTTSQSITPSPTSAIPQRPTMLALLTQGPQGLGKYIYAY